MFVIYCIFVYTKFFCLHETNLATYGRIINVPTYMIWTGSKHGSYDLRLFTMDIRIIEEHNNNMISKNSVYMRGFRELSLEKNASITNSEHS